MVLPKPVQSLCCHVSMFILSLLKNLLQNLQSSFLQPEIKKTRFYLFVCWLVSSSVCKCLSVHSFVCLSAYLFVCLSACLSVCLCVRPSVCVSVFRPSIHPSVCLFVCPSVCLHVCQFVRFPFLDYNFHTLTFLFHFL